MYFRYQHQGMLQVPSYQFYLINLLSLTFIEVTHTNKFIILQNEWSLE